MICIENLNVQLPGFSLDHIDLTVEKGEFFTLLGPTGAGKTVVLESVIGVVPITSGRIRVNDKDVTRLAPEKRGIGIVYQDTALFPHLTVYQNIIFGLRYHKNGKSPQKASSLIIERLSLTHLLNRSVLHLSGGEKQRVALARALVVDPSILLLDEPLSSLDPNFREEIREILKNLHGELGITVLMVTHDFSEAHSLAQRAAVINNGRIEQIGTVSQVFQHPVTQFAADFVGMKNIFPAEFEGGTARIGNLSVKLDASAGKGSEKYIAIRPEDIKISRNGFPPDIRNVFRGPLTRILNQGFYCDVSIDIQGVGFRSVLLSRSLLGIDLSEGDQVFIGFRGRDVHVF